MQITKEMVRKTAFCSEGCNLGSHLSVFASWNDLRASLISNTVFNGLLINCNRNRLLYSRLYFCRGHSSRSMPYNTQGFKPRVCTGNMADKRILFLF
jgi:hypothetical protein